VVATIAAVVAAVAGMLAVYYAWKTAREGAKSDQAALGAMADQLEAVKAATAETWEQHRAETDARTRAAALEASNTRMAQLGEVSALLRKMSKVAKEERRHPPDESDSSDRTKGSEMPALILHLKNSVSAMNLPGPAPTALLSTAINMPSSPEQTTSRFHSEDFARRQWLNKIDNQCQNCMTAITSEMAQIRIKDLA
jgi:hypothetical protein